MFFVIHVLKLFGCKPAVLGRFVTLSALISFVTVFTNFLESTPGFEELITLFLIYFIMFLLKSFRKKIKRIHKESEII